ncbi:MAG: hypothetical protein H6908_03090 [Hyphomicrobiales bacterium]|nr:hypothetical protein [Hyphomicrobiales bacterium]
MSQAAGFYLVYTLMEVTFCVLVIWACVEYLHIVTWQDVYKFAIPLTVLVGGLFGLMFTTGVALKKNLKSEVSFLPFIVMASYLGIVAPFLALMPAAYLTMQDQWKGREES